MIERCEDDCVVREALMTTTMTVMREMMILTVTNVMAHLNLSCKPIYY